MQINLHFVTQKVLYQADFLLFFITFADTTVFSMENKITLQDKTFKKYIPNQDIEKAIDEVAARMNSDFVHVTDENPPIMLCTLNGAVIFAAELLKRIHFPVIFTAMKISSYEGTKSTGNVKAEVPAGIPDLKGKKVIVVEDIVDTGNTIIAIDNLLRGMGVEKMYVASLLLKPDVYKGNVPLDYVAMKIPNRFIVGFGLDYNELGRNIKDIYVLDC